MKWLVKKAKVYPEDLSNLYFIAGQLEGIATYTTLDEATKNKLNSLVSTLQNELEKLSSRLIDEE